MACEFQSVTKRNYQTTRSISQINSTIKQEFEHIFCKLEIFLLPCIKCSGQITNFFGAVRFVVNLKWFSITQDRNIGNCSNPCKIWVFQKDIFKFVTPWFIHWCYLVCISLVDSTICFWSQIFLFGVTTKLQFGIHMQMTINGWA